MSRVEAGTLALGRRSDHHAIESQEVLVTDLTRVQRRLLTLLGLPPKHYGH